MNNKEVNIINSINRVTISGPNLNCDAISLFDVLNYFREFNKNSIDQEKQFNNGLKEMFSKWNKGIFCGIDFDFNYGVIYLDIYSHDRRDLIKYRLKLENDDIRINIMDSIGIDILSLFSNYLVSYYNFRYKLYQLNGFKTCENVFGKDITAIVSDKYMCLHFDKRELVPELVFQLKKDEVRYNFNSKMCVDFVNEKSIILCKNLYISINKFPSSFRSDFYSIRKKDMVNCVRRKKKILNKQKREEAFDKFYSFIRLY